MAIELIGGKQPLTLANPTLLAAGAAGFSTEYNRLIDLKLLGGMITNPITWRPRRAASGIRVVALDGGAIVHTGLPNPGLTAVVRTHSPAWGRSTCPVIVHIAAEAPDDVRRCIETLNGLAGVAAIEIGVLDSASPRDVLAVLKIAHAHADLPLIARLPLYTAPLLAASAVEGGAGALTIAAPPRGTARDPLSGQLVGGRAYGPWLKPLALRTVGQVAREVSIPVIGCGGIHTPDDARDFVEAGAKAIQLDSVVWIRPDMAEVIARNLGGLEVTRMVGALADEWQPGLGATAALRVPPVASPPSRPPR